MAKVKSYYTEVADEQVSDILKSYTDGKITADKAKSDISKVDNLNLLDIDDNNIDIEQDHVQFVKDLIMASEHAKSSKGKTREREFLYVVTEIYRDKKKKREHNYDVTGTNSWRTEKTRSTWTSSIT